MTRGSRRHPPLSLAVRSDHADCVNVLLHVTNREHSGEDGINVLHSAARNGNNDIVRLLAEAGRDVNVKDTSGAAPLFYAAGDGWVSAARKLLALGADPWVKDKDGKTANDYAGQRGNAEAWRKLRVAIGQTDH